MMSSGASRIHDHGLADSLATFAFSTMATRLGLEFDQEKPANYEFRSWSAAARQASKMATTGGRLDKPVSRLVWAAK
ncbi:MAG: hypothetical protein Ct9H300mP8_09940 [Gammaproteobacteria bacterium]|nr:MAG: hypothetical protein Ct9H300mP8_09940 [Gammaproteobacteria bacterium]